MKFSPDGDVEWKAPCRFSVEGSHASSIQIRSGREHDDQGRALTIFFSGNPSKFLQGHNVFGSDNIVALMLDAYLALCQKLSLTPSASELLQVSTGDYPVFTVDINYSFELPRRQDVLSWIRAAEYKSKTRHGRPQMKGGTLYWGKSSSRWAMKVYSKGEEIEASGHELPEDLKQTNIPNWADNKLRLELRLKKKELTELGIQKARDITPEVAQKLHSSYARKIEMNQQIALSTEDECSLPKRLRSTYLLWKSGLDLRSTVSKATFYRHRKELAVFGIDITLRQDAADRSNVIPLVRVLEATPSSIPDWAFTESLVHHSATH